MQDLATVLDDLGGLITESEKHILMHDALVRLKSNTDFIKVIEQGYLTNLALTSVRRKGYDNCVGVVADAVEKDLIGIGRLNNYFESIAYTAVSARQSIVDANRAIDEVQSN